MIQIPFNKTKIVATIGPATSSKKAIKDLIVAGADVFRLNFSHGSHQDHKKVIDHINNLNDELETNVCKLLDLQGPKIRVNEVEEGVKLKAGNQFIITTQETVGNEFKASTSYKNLVNDVSIGDMILIDDGKVELIVEEIREDEVLTKVVHGGKLRSRKGINLPKSHVTAPSLTSKDLKDLQFGIDNDIEWIALSFVRSAEDIHQLRKIIEECGKDLRIIAKVEKPEAVKNIDEIIEASDAIMVARGDLGVEILLEEVPLVQKSIVNKCKEAGKPVIIATQMMESMIENLRPTRAETNDVANAVLDGADALMLSGETAVGAFPVEVIKTMVNTITSVETRSEKIYFNHFLPNEEDPLFLSHTVLLAACRLAKASKAKAITGLTHRGLSAFRIASHRPKATIVIFSANKPFLKTMNLIWGVRCIYYDKTTSTDDTIKDIEQLLISKGFIGSGDIFISTASMPIQEKGRANMVKINIAE